VAMNYAKKLWKDQISVNFARCIKYHCEEKEDNVKMSMKLKKKVKNRTDFYVEMQKRFRLQIQSCSDYSDRSDIPDTQIIPRCSKY